MTKGKKEGTSKKKEGTSKLKVKRKTGIKKGSIPLISGNIFDVKARKGYVYRLGREKYRVLTHYEDDKDDNYIFADIIDSVNMNELKGKGWIPVPAKRHPELFAYHSDGLIRHGGLILLERPVALQEQEDKKLNDAHSKIIDSLPGLEKFSPDFGPCRLNKDKLYFVATDIANAKAEKLCHTFVRVSQYNPEWFSNQEAISHQEENRENNQENKFYLIKVMRKLSYKLRSMTIKIKTKFLLWIEAICFKLNIVEYHLDKEEIEVCKNLDIKEDAYKLEKYKIRKGEIMFGRPKLYGFGNKSRSI